MLAGLMEFQETSILQSVFKSLYTLQQNSRTLFQQLRDIFLLLFQVRKLCMRINDQLSRMKLTMPLNNNMEKFTYYFLLISLTACCAEYLASIHKLNNTQNSNQCRHYNYKLVFPFQFPNEMFGKSQLAFSAVSIVNQIILCLLINILGSPFSIWKSSHHTKLSFELRQQKNCLLRHWKKFGLENGLKSRKLSRFKIACQF